MCDYADLCSVGASKVRQFSFVQEKYVAWSELCLWTVVPTANGGAVWEGLLIIVVSWLVCKLKLLSLC